MADVELVIKIPIEETIEENSKAYFDYFGCMSKKLYATLKNSTPLPKGHGKIGDIDKLHDIFKKACDAYNIDNLSFISEVNMNFDLIPTIIEADKGIKD